VHLENLRIQKPERTMNKSSDVVTRV